MFDNIAFKFLLTLEYDVKKDCVFQFLFCKRVKYNVNQPVNVMRKVNE